MLLNSGKLTKVPIRKQNWIINKYSKTII